jgi:hypothetical protein
VVKFKGEWKISDRVLLRLKLQLQILELRFVDNHEIVERVVPESFSDNAFSGRIQNRDQIFNLKLAVIV